jgi:hypothetical protein
MPLLSKAKALRLAVLEPPTRRPQPKEACQTRHLDESGSPRVRLLMSVGDAQALADLLSAQTPARSEQRLLDQLWLRTVLIEQHRRIRRTERIGFRIRADRLLEALDPPTWNII